MFISYPILLVYTPKKFKIVYHAACHCCYSEIVNKTPKNPTKNKQTKNNKTKQTKQNKNK